VPTASDWNERHSAAIGAIDLSTLHSSGIFTAMSKFAPHATPNP
jgi:hypothetical protein